ncbi:hypothetical protein HMPREF3205_00279 [Streptococcus pasteurianus]|nr:hypothetical protein HMPREF3205_00279 [Streptococcus pasteurianus]
MYVLIFEECAITNSTEIFNLLSCVSVGIMTAPKKREYQG